MGKSKFDELIKSLIEVASKTDNPAKLYKHIRALYMLNKYKIAMDKYNNKN